MIRNMYHLLQLMLDAESFKSDRQELAKNSLEERILFFLINDINKSDDIADSQSNFSKEERKTWFGKEDGVQIEEITWERVRNLLMPAARENAVFRVNEALNGSKINERFTFERAGKNGKKEIGYGPRTVTVYESEKQAVAAAKFLNMVLKGSGATIVAEHLDDGTKQGAWAVSDNMNLATHNALRLFTALIFAKEHKDFDAIKEDVQKNVNQRLPHGEQWDVWFAMNEFLTLHGRPGVKMYRTLSDGRDNPEDVECLSILDSQQTPLCMRDLSSAITTRGDGRILSDEISRSRELSYLLFGENVTDLFFDGNTYYLKEAFGQPLKEAFIRRYDGSVNSAAYNTTRSAADTLSVVSDYLIHGVATAVGLTSGVATLIVGMTAAGAIKALGAKDNLLHGPIRRYVEAKTGSLTTSPITKTWNARPGGELHSNLAQAIGSAPERQKNRPPATDQEHVSIDSVVAEHTIPMTQLDLARSVTTNQASRKQFSEDFSRYMADKWNLPEELKPDHADGIKSALQRYASAYADFTVLLMDIERMKYHHTVPSQKEQDSFMQQEAAAVDDMQKAAVAFNSMLHNGLLHKFSSNIAVQISQQVRANVESGFAEYLEQVENKQGIGR